MKKILILLFLTISSVVSATRYYVSTSGNDANDGRTTTTPWKTIHYAETHAIIAGDVIALKKGDVWLTATALGIHHGGIAGNPIIWDGSLWGTGANPVIRSSANRTGSNMSVVNITGCSNVTFQNITVDGNNTYTFGLVIGGTNNVYSPGGIQNAEKYIVVQNCSIINIGNGLQYAIGLLCQTWNNGISDITLKGNILNGSDDELLSFYGGQAADGATPSLCKNVYIGYNSLTNWGRRGQTTGYGLQINNKITDVIIENNTLTTGLSGHGNAFQIESNESVTGYFPERITIRYNKIYSTLDNNFCLYISQGQAKTIDVHNNLFYSSTRTTSGGGIWVVSSASPSWTGARLNFYNNTIYTLGGRSFTNDCAVAGVVTLKNNLLYNSGSDDYGMMCLNSNTAGATIHSNNLYYRSANVNYTKIKDGGSYKQTNAQVLAWETTAKAGDPLFKTPGSDYHLQTGSPAIRGGIAITGITKDIDGVAFNIPPDIGSYQATVITSLPVYLSSVIENTTPALLEMTYNQSLSNIVPAPSSFNVLVNSISRSVNSVAIVGSKVRLTLSSAVVFGNIVTVSYTKPALNPLQSSGGQAASISAKPVTLNVTAISANRYYVSTSGNDANDGKTTSTPWKTIQYAESHAIKAGDVIALKKGDVWLTATALGIHHGGIAENPIIWDGSLWGTGANPVIRSSANRTGSNMSVVNITGCSNVTFQNITVDGNNTYTFGLVIGGTDNMYSPGGIQNAEKYIVVQNCSIINIGNGLQYAIGLLCQTWNNGISDITLKGNILNGSDDELLSFYGGKTASGATPALCKNVYIGYNSLTNWGRRGQTTGYGLQINNKITDVIIEKNTITTGSGGHGNAVQIESNESVAGYFPERITVRYNKITSTLDNNFCLYISQGQAKTVDVYNNLFYSSTRTTSGGGIWVVSSASPSWTGARLNFYNNTIYTLGGRSFINDCAVAGVVTLKNNLLYNSGSDDYGMMCLNINTAGATTHSNNLYYKSANVNYTKIKDGGSYKQTNVQVLAWESTAKAANPLFMVTGTDFHLQSGSPASGGGIAITGITKDIDGVAFNFPPDIGCYQSASASKGLVTNNAVMSVSKQPSNIPGFTIYPNPAHRIVNISIEASEIFSEEGAKLSSRIIRIFDLSGKLVLQKLTDQGVSEVQIPINLKAGVYVVNLEVAGVILSSHTLIVTN